MSVKDKLEIILITYNRYKYLKNTLENLFSENSPVRDFDITILNNKSTDGSTELIEEYRHKFNNIKHVINNRNIGGNGNIAKALTIAKKEYLWVICDDDLYEWDNWCEVEKAINDKHDIIVVDNEYIMYPKEPYDVVFQLSFLPSGIYKNAIIDNTVSRNIYDNIAHWFPHLPIALKIAMTTKDFYILSKPILKNGQQERIDNCKKTAPDSLVRGAKYGELYPEQENMNWHIAYINSLSLLRSRKEIRKAINFALKHPPHGVGKTLYQFCKEIVIKTCGNTSNKNLFYDVYSRVDTEMRFLLLWHRFKYNLISFYKNENGYYLKIGTIKMKVIPRKAKNKINNVKK